MKLIAVTVTALLMAFTITLAFGYYFVQPHSTGLSGQVRIYALQARELAFGCERQAQIGKRIFEDTTRDAQTRAFESREWFEMALSCDSVVALDHLGFMYINSLGVDQDIDRGLAMLNQAKAAGYAEAAKTLAWEYMYGNPLEIDSVKAVQNLEICATEMDQECRAFLAEQLAYGVDPPNYLRAFMLAQDAAESGEPRAQGVLAMLYAFGQGVNSDYGLAKSWAEKGAERDDPYALDTLAHLFLEGLGVPPDAQKGIEYLETSAAAGDSSALFTLGKR